MSSPIGERRAALNRQHFHTRHGLVIDEASVECVALVRGTDAPCSWCPGLTAGGPARWASIEPGRVVLLCARCHRTLGKRL